MYVETNLSVNLDRPADACLSEDGKYRWLLSRYPGASLPGAPEPVPMIWIMLNPSTASAYEDDPTVRRVERFTLEKGDGVFNSFIIANLFHVRTPKPAELARADDPYGPMSWEPLEWALDEAESRLEMAGADGIRPKVVAAWGGSVPGKWRRRTAMCLDVLLDRGVKPWCLGVTGSGQPRHPLFVPASQPLVPYTPPDPVQG